MKKHCFIVDRNGQALNKCPIRLNLGTSYNGSNAGWYFGFFYFLSFFGPVFLVKKTVLTEML